MALHSVRGSDGFGADEGVDVDADAGFFEMSPAGAEQVTLQIRSMMERAWEYIAIAYQGRAHIALGYETWDEYVDDRLGDLRLTVPRQERGAVVQSLSRAQMSLRAIAKVLGVDVATVHRALGADDPAGAAGREGVDDASPIRGRDGKQYPRRCRPTAMAVTCSICGEVHEGDPDECPWDLFAQGLGPRPVRQDCRSGASVDCREREEVVEVAVTSDHPEEAGATSSPDSTIDEEVQAATIVDSVTRAVFLVGELATLPELIEEIELVGVSAEPAELAAGIRELIEHLRVQAAAIVTLADRLERIAPQR
ncbi:helix-turn-helix domain-containing protein [Nakamurella multipartita]|uniref:Uncharacterized protein n=1 Tax=Nakamurella multipartita (strain ATCC 700099 / DSM 44233 / CIP 104796 / JCM 9543 / NBRC 105858 / Y-104) TaxID=479431 RepID=C8X683_NAKMY|nr:helix-turn-helix domain-containing protein [Nakamurella multipartita]ACV76854.1 hypothetical protein Namu_0434 [Nakamurella multipartita DSM 44233]